MAVGNSADVAAAAGRRRRRRRRSDGARAGLRFALYGRMSTRGFQDRVTSLGWQRDMAVATIAGRGRIVVEYFDVGCSRRLSWEQRTEAAALLSAARDGLFDAVVVGEYERAFCGGQFRSVIQELATLGVQVWLPEVGGPVEIGDPTCRALLLMLGAQSQREVVRARHRVRAAMWSQVAVQGRFLGGRPPYGYRLVDAGPHPNAVHAQWGRRLHRLEPDPVTVPWVRWMFAQRAAGRSVAGIARELNERGVPCPSSVDRERNRHRSGEAWLVRTVIGILENPRYTGRQVWNRHSGSGPHGGAGEWTAPSEWAVSPTRVHSALVDDATFAAVQGMRAARRTEDGHVRSYVLAGLVLCEVCGRRLDSHTAKKTPGYRCRHGRGSDRTSVSGGPKGIYIAEGRLLAELRDRLGGAGANAGAVVDYLVSTGQVIVTDGRTWRVALSDLVPAVSSGWGK
jgi:DNA invertase Pin-like site-specific DNA recombinase